MTPDLQEARPRAARLEPAQDRPIMGRLTCLFLGHPPVDATDYSMGSKTREYLCPRCGAVVVKEWNAHG